MCVGTCQENRDYIYKSGKWENSEKEDTRLEGMQFESGECPIERPGKRNDLEELKNLLWLAKQMRRYTIQMPLICVTPHLLTVFVKI